jgi:transposase InsO family protein
MGVGAAIAAIGMAVPERLVSNEQLAARLGIGAAWIAKRTGPRVRPWATTGELRLEHQIRVGRKRVERLMRAAGISGVLPRKRRRTTVRPPGLRVAPDLVERDFRPLAPNVTWSADITCIPTWEAFLYLAHVQDLFSRLIVGWSMGDHLRA